MSTNQPPDFSRIVHMSHQDRLVQTADHKPPWVVVVGVTSGSISAPSRLVYHEHELPQVRNLAWWNASCTGYLDRAQGIMMPGVAVRWCRATPTVPMRKHLSSLFEALWPEQPSSQIHARKFPATENTLCCIKFPLYCSMALILPNLVTRFQSNDVPHILDDYCTTA